MKGKHTVPIRIKLILMLLVLFNSSIWFFIGGVSDVNFHIITCDVGQGDAILVTQGTTQILIDGGPNTKVLGCLSRYLPFWDREIEMVVNTHPEKDHFLGLIEVFKRYKVNNLLVSPVTTGSQEYKVLISQVRGSKVNVVNPIAGTKVRAGLIYLDILNPVISEFNNGKHTSKLADTRDGSLGTYLIKDSVNMFSIVILVSYKDFDILITGDIENEKSDFVADEIGQNGFRDIEVLKVPHHGSKNGLSQKLLDVVNPSIALISVGAKNGYGHPHKEILDMLLNKRVRILRTDEMGDIEIVSDGDKMWLADAKNSL